MSRQENFADCVVEHLPFLNRMVRSLTRSDSLSEDIVQQTILKALVHANQFRSESTLKAWLASIATNEVRQVYRCKWWTRSVPLTTENLEDDRSPFEQSPNAYYQAREREVLFRHAVSCLPEPYRRVVELCDLQCLTLEEAASRLRLTLSAIKTRRRRARMRLWPLVSALKS
jgi:RNA polymerase sigma-70 factor (ECF subfamily)